MQKLPKKWLQMVEPLFIETYFSYILFILGFTRTCIHLGCWRSFSWADTDRLFRQKSLSNFFTLPISEKGSSMSVIDWLSSVTNHVLADRMFLVVGCYKFSLFLTNNCSMSASTLQLVQIFEQQFLSENSDNPKFSPSASTFYRTILAIFFILCLPDRSRWSKSRAATSATITPPATASSACPTTSAAGTEQSSPTGRASSTSGAGIGINSRITDKMEPNAPLQSWGHLGGSGPELGTFGILSFFQW